MLAVPFFLQQCKHEPILRKIVLPGDTTNNQNPTDTTICFERDILPLFVSNCAKTGCHNDITAEENMSLTSYNGIRNAKDNGIVPFNSSKSKLMKEIVNGNMNGNGSSPYGNLTAAQIALIKRWINEGAKNGTNCPSKCDTTKFTYTNAITPLFTKYCNACHNGTGSSSKVDLSNWAAIKVYVDNGKLWADVNGTGNLMPKSGKLSDCELKQIKKWIDAGAQNN